MQARPDSATAPVDSLCVDSLSANSRPVERLVLSADDDVLLDALQRAAFSYFLEQVDPGNGLVADTSRADAPVSIAVVVLRCPRIPSGWSADG